MASSRGTRALGPFKVHKCWDSSLVKLNHSNIAVVSGTTKLFVLNHEKGCNIKQLREISVSGIRNVLDIDGYGQTIAAVGEKGKAEVWDYLAGKRTASFKIVAGISLIRMSVDFIILGRWKDGIINMHENGGNYNLLASTRKKQRNNPAHQ